MARNNCPDQGPRLSADEYCRLYADEAQRQMARYGIPASITLAQGMYESGYGSSYIAVVGNNHFGIKAYRDWNGPAIHCDDDTDAEPFCKFETVQQSYEYHSLFLKNSPRYASLFRLSSRDYKGWAKGLLECGYATSRQYTDKLIEIIERYGLDKFDQGAKASAAAEPAKPTKNTLFGKKSGSGKSSSSHRSSANKRSNTKPASSASTNTNTGYVSTVGTRASTRHQLYTTSEKGGIRYVMANQNDYLVIIAREFGVSERKLRNYNEMSKDYKLKAGEIVYLEAKHTSSDPKHPTHIVQRGESLHGIAQKYGVTVRSIAERNNLATGAIQVGQTLRLR